jgi:hypothetical protein
MAIARPKRLTTVITDPLILPMPTLPGDVPVVTPAPAQPSTEAASETPLEEPVAVGDPPKVEQPAEGATAEPGAEAVAVEAVAEGELVEQSPVVPRRIAALR